jgi:hypothetical protein
MLLALRQWSNNFNEALKEKKIKLGSIILQRRSRKCDPVLAILLLLLHGVDKAPDTANCNTSGDKTTWRWPAGACRLGT